MCSPKMPKAKPIATTPLPPPAPPPEPTATAPDRSQEASQKSSDSSQIKGKRRGTSSLRIDLSVPGGNSAGLNIPQ